MRRDRRRLLLAGAAAGGVAALGAGIFHRIRRPELDFSPLSSPQGFRSLAAGPVSQGYDPLVGIPTGGEGIEGGSYTTAADLCAALFGEYSEQGVVPIASFSDYRCPYCRHLTERLVRLEENDPQGLRVTWHELPLLGDASVSAARAALAAKRQGAYVDFHQRMMRTAFQPTESYLEALAESMNLDAARLIADMESTDVTTELNRSLMLARTFGFVGTPALVVGRTVVVGEIDQRRLGRLIEIERQAGSPGVCRSA